MGDKFKALCAHLASLQLSPNQKGKRCLLVPICPSTLYFRELLYHLWAQKAWNYVSSKPILTVLLAILAAAFVGCFHFGLVSPPTGDDSYILIQGWTPWKLVSAF